MPAIKVLFRPDSLPGDQLISIKDPLRAIIAEAITTRQYNVQPHMVDWKPEILHPQSEFQTPVTIVIETADHFDRKDKFKRNPLLKSLATKIAEDIPFFNQAPFTLKIDWTPEDNDHVHQNT